VQTHLILNTEDRLLDDLAAWVSPKVTDASSLSLPSSPKPSAIQQLTACL
jgi:hypothetical protein